MNKKCSPHKKTGNAAARFLTPTFWFAQAHGREAAWQLAANKEVIELKASWTMLGNLPAEASRASRLAAARAARDSDETQQN